MSSRDHTITSNGSNVVSSGTRWPCPGPSTIVPMLGIEFREAARRVLALVKEQDELPDTPEADARSEEITEQWERLAKWTLCAIPRTPADSVAVIDTALCPATAPNFDGPTKELFLRIRGVLVQAALEAAQRDGGATSATQIAASNSIINDLQRWLSLEAAMTAGGEAEMMDAAEEAFGIASRIASYSENPTVGMAAQAMLLWASHSAACPPAGAPGALHRPPAVELAQTEDDALLFGMVHNACRAVPELAMLFENSTEASSRPTPANGSSGFLAAIESLKNRALPAIPKILTDEQAVVGGAAAGCSPEAFRLGLQAVLKTMEAA